MAPIIPPMFNMTTRPQTAASGPPYYQEVFGATNVAVERGLVFIIMPFVGMDEIHAAIRGACTELRLTPIRADDMVGSGYVMKEVDLRIRQAEVIVCDLSDSRPNVYYELGYAHGVGNQSKNIFLVASKGTDLQFDVVPQQVHAYETPEDLRKLLLVKLPLLLEKIRGPDKLSAGSLVNRG